MVSVIAIQSFSQNTTISATKIDEYNDAKSTSETIETKTQLFLDGLSRSPRTTNGVIIVYPKLISTCSFSNPWKPDRKTLEFVSHLVAEYKDISKNRVKILSGNPYLRTTAEFWFVPKGAKQPEPEKKEFDPNCCCPTIDIIGPAQIDPTSGKVSLAVQLQPDSNTDGVKYQWEASGAVISSGRGTDVIEVDVSKLRTSTLKVSVKLQVQSICNCPTFASIEIPVSK